MSFGVFDPHFLLIILHVCLSLIIIDPIILSRDYYHHEFLLAFGCLLRGWPGVWFKQLLMLMENLYNVPLSSTYQSRI